MLVFPTPGMPPIITRLEDEDEDEDEDEEE